MKMQEVITKYRELTPDAFFAVQQATKAVEEARAVAADASRASSDVTRAVLTSTLWKRLSDLGSLVDKAYSAIDELHRVNERYTAVLGPRKRKPKDDPRQLELELEPSPSLAADDANAAFAAGRHG